MTTTDTLCTACQHPAHWRGCQAIVRGPLGSDTRCACHRRGPQPDATDDRTEGAVEAFAKWRRDPNRVTADDINRR